MALKWEVTGGGASYAQGIRFTECSFSLFDGEAGSARVLAPMSHPLNPTTRHVGLAFDDNRPLGRSGSILQQGATFLLWCESGLEGPIRRLSSRSRKPYSQEKHRGSDGLPRLPNGWTTSPGQRVPVAP